LIYDQKNERQIVDEQKMIVASRDKHVVMVASENAALNGGKVGGVGDIVRDIPKALATFGWHVTVITPSYGFLHTMNESTLQSKVIFPFMGNKIAGEIWEVISREPHDHILHLVFEHPDISGNPIYFDDPPGEPFNRDATKFALFCSAVGTFLKSFGSPFVLHLHDWHTATLLLLRNLHLSFTHLKRMRTIFTIHNLSFQGTRPMFKDPSSLENWFPELFQNSYWIEKWKDSRYTEPCYSPMAIGIQYADKVNTVSPSYAEEILQPSNHAVGLYRGEGLESVLQQAKNEGRLFGILNGCEYPEQRIIPRQSFADMCKLFGRDIQQWMEKRNDPRFRMLTQGLERIRFHKPSILLTSVTRVVEQKIKLLFERGSNGKTAIEQILTILQSRNGVYFFCGIGAKEYEDRLWKLVETHEHFFFLNGYSDIIAPLLFANGDLFIMPSSFEPCGISQMVAMRDGQPCLVHAVGGLKDTVQDGVNGFAFSGDTIIEQVDRFVATTEKALKLFFEDKKSWEKMRLEASNTRFTWEKSAKEYIDLLYT
jgi:starch synthase